MNLKFNKFRLEAGIVFSYFLVSLVLLFPLLSNFFSQLPFASNGDIRLCLTILFSNLKKISLGDLPSVFQLPILFPLSYTLTAGVNLFGQTLLVLPFYIVHIRNVYLIYNFLTFFAYIAAGYFAYRFAREWVTERWIAWLVGALYILLPFRVHNIPHLNLMFSFPIPLTLLFFSRFLKNRRTKDLVLFFLSLFFQFLCDLSLALFLGIALAVFFLVQQSLFGLLPKQSWIRLVTAAILFILAVIFLFSPYLNRQTSFSNIDELTSIRSGSFSTPLSFYSTWSYLLFFSQRIFWNQSPLSPGISVFIFFMLAFFPYLENRIQRLVALVCTFFLIAPAIAVPIIFDSLSLNRLNQICYGSLLIFLGSLSVLLVLIRKKIPRELSLLTITWIVLQFNSSQVGMGFFNLFEVLARLLPFLLRSRGIRTEYILLLLFFTVAAFGIAFFFKRCREKKLILALALMLVFVERFRWPVSSARLNDDRPVYRKFYRSLAAYPDHFGLLELPFYPQNSNHYPLFTLYHDKHTYHGQIFYLEDYYELNSSPQLQVEKSFSGLSDPWFIQTLKTNGIRLLLLFKDKFGSESNRTWFQVQNQIRRGERSGLYEKVEKTPMGILLVLAEREQGSKIRYFLPYYSLKGKKNLVCTVRTSQETAADFFLNERPLMHLKLQARSVSTVRIGIQEIRLALQFNHLEIRSLPSLELLKVRIE